MSFLLLLTFFCQDDPQQLRILAEKNSANIYLQAVLPDKVANTFPRGNVPQEQGERILRWSLLDPDSGKPGPAILGTYDREGKILSYRPRFALLPGMTYRATLAIDPDHPIELDHRTAAAKPTPAVEVVKVFPSADKIPANNLKFYIYFSAPIRGGKDLFENIYLEDDNGKRLERVWLLDELWDENENCLLLYIHPGRIKWGLLMRQLLGPVLFPGRQYTLVVSTRVLDRGGKPIKAEYRYKFKATAENRTRIDLSEWKITAPEVGSSTPLQINTVQAMDHRSLQRFLKVIAPDGSKVTGKMLVGEKEQCWTFIPSQPWQEGKYRLEVGEDFEDVAGNSPTRPFDLDLSSSQPPAQSLQLPFQPRLPRP